MVADVAVPHNPAGRLLELVFRARQTSQSHGATAGWAQVFGVESGDLASVLRHGSRLVAMAKDTRRQITALDPTAAPIYLKHFSEVDGMVNNFQQLTLTMEQFLLPIRPQTGEYCLEICSLLLDGHRRESVLSNDQVDDLHSELLDLIQAVRDADDLMGDFRDWLLGKLADILDRINTDRLYTLAEVEEAADSLVGGMLQKADRIAQIKRSRIGPKIVHFIVALDLAINLASNTKQLLPGSTPTPPPPSPSVVIFQQQTNICIDFSALPSGNGAALDTANEVSPKALPATASE